MIIHPLLVKFRRTTMGYPSNIDKEDLPSYMHDKNGEDQWVWILDQMIWTHYEIGYNIENNLFDDMRLQRIYDKKIDNGLRLFAKYYRSIWS